VILASFVGGGILVQHYLGILEEEIVPGNLIIKKETELKEEVTPLKPEEMIPGPEEILLLESQIENWSLYQEIVNEEDKWVGADFCGNKEFEEVLLEAKGGSMKILELNDALDLVITPNYKNWTNEEFTAFNNDPTAICAAGGRYPQYAYSDKLLWSGSCGTGFMPEITSPIYKEWKENQIRCEKAREVVEVFFAKKGTTDWKTYKNSKWGYEIKYPRNFYAINVYGGDTGAISNVELPEYKEGSVTWMGRSVIYFGAENGILVTINYQGDNREMSLEKWLKWRYPEADLTRYKSTNIARQSALLKREEASDVCISPSLGVCQSEDAPKGSFVDYDIYLLRDSTVFQIMAQIKTENIEYDTIFNQMLSTFQFLE